MNSIHGICFVFVCALAIVIGSRLEQTIVLEVDHQNGTLEPIIARCSELTILSDCEALLDTNKIRKLNTQMESVLFSKESNEGGDDNETNDSETRTGYVQKTLVTLELLQETDFRYNHHKYNTTFNLDEKYTSPSFEAYFFEKRNELLYDEIDVLRQQIYNTLLLVEIEPHVSCYSDSAPSFFIATQCLSRSINQMRLTSKYDVFMYLTTDLFMKLSMIDINEKLAP